MRPPVRNQPPRASRESTNRKKRSRNDDVEDARRTKRKITKSHPETLPDSDDRDDDLVRSDEIRQLISDLLKTKCRLYRTTPMMIGERSIHNIRRWCKIIQLALIQNNTYQCSTKDWHYKVEFETVQGIAKSPSDSNALQFKIYRRECASEFSSQAEQRDFALVCNGLFAARESMRRKKNAHQLSYLPLLLVNGPEGIFKAIKQSIESLFHCVIVPMDDISSSEIKIIAGRYLMTSWLEEDSLLDKNSPLTFYFSVQKTDRRFDHEGSVPLRAFEPVMEGVTTVSNKEATLLWYDFFGELNTPVVMDFFTPTCKIDTKTFAITNTGSVKAKHPSTAVCLDLVSSLTWCAEGGASRVLSNRHQEEDRIS